MANSIINTLKKARESQDALEIFKKLKNGNSDQVVTDALDPLGIASKADKKLGDTKAEDTAAATARQAALNQFLDIPIPDLQAPDLALESSLGPTDLEKIKDIPSLAEMLKNLPAVEAGGIPIETLTGSAMENLALDPRYKEATDNSLAALNDIIAGGGMTAQERAQMAKVQSDINAQDRGRREAIIQNAQARGMGNSGIALLNQLQAAQDAASRQSQADLDIAAQGQARQLDTILKSGAFAKDLGAQEFGQKSDIAKARDAIDVFNKSQTNQYTDRGADRKLSADLAARSQMVGAMGTDVGNAKDVAMKNVDITNTGRLADKNAAIDLGVRNTNRINENNIAKAGIPQQTFRNRLDVAAGASGQYGNIAETEEQKAERKARERAQREAALIGAGTTAAKAAAGGY